MRGTLATLLAATCLLSGCGETRGRDPGPAAATLASTRPVVPQLGPFRHTGRGDFQSRTTPVTAARLGSSHRAGCPTPVSDLRLVQVTHWGFDGVPRSGELVVHRTHAAGVVQVFRRLYDARFPVQRMVTVEQYGADDARSMAANNTSAYNCRRTTGGSTWSEHAYGTALDINPVQNPYVRGSSVEPPAGRAYLDRRDVRTGMIVANDVVVRAFAGIGWEWGGDFRTLKDYQHFSASGR
ncbi:MAG TPA: M15 family metallopeptidase [Pilimelia sp.]|nr:M15 family metallopeptidase [Pilimelia sp.]